MDSICAEIEALGQSPTDEQLYNVLSKILRKEFKYFLRKTFYHLHPDGEFLQGMHIDIMSDYAQSMVTGENKRLIVNIPPRYLKSICFSVALPAWILGLFPSAKIIVASYSKALSHKHSEDCRFVMESDWYQYIFPHTRLAKKSNSVSKFMTTERGFRFAGSINSTLTGEGADYIIVDDPQTPAQAASSKYQNKVNDWFKQTLMSRLNDKENGRIALVMQRLHPKDLTGELMDGQHKDRWHHVALQAIAEDDRKVCVRGKEYMIKSGSILNGAQMNKNILHAIKIDIGLNGFQAQYQQDPYSINNGVIKEKWIKRYSKMPSQWDAVVQSWDFAVKTDANKHDYSVCSTWGLLNGSYYLIDVFRDQLEYPYLSRKVQEIADKFSPSTIIIEDKATGQQIIQEMRYHGGYNIIGVNPRYDKTTRVMLSSVAFEKGEVVFPKYAPWLNDLEEEIFTFPNSKHDDQIDTITQLILWKNNIAKGNAFVGSNEEGRMRTL